MPVDPSPSAQQPTRSRSQTLNFSRLQPPRLTTSRGRPSIGIRRLTSSSSVVPLNELSAVNPTASNANGANGANSTQDESSSRRRSFSEPERLQSAPVPQIAITRTTTRPEYMPSVVEETNQGQSFPGLEPTSTHPVYDEMTGKLVRPNMRRDASNMSVLSRASTAARSVFGFGDRSQPVQSGGSSRGMEGTQYDSDVVDWLDVVDPEVSTLSTLTNVQNSLFVPDLGSWLNRRPTYTLTPRVSNLNFRPTELNKTEDKTMEEEREGIPELSRTYSLDTINSRLDESRFAVLPHGVSLEGWTEAEKQELNDHVRHLLHSRREGFKRSMKGFGQYVRRPLGLFVTIYATLVTVFGLVWVLFLIGWVSGGGRRSYDINVIDNVLVALFALIGDTLAPFRAIDTYHMIYIAHYHHLTWRLRNEKQLPKLPDHNDLPISRDGSMEGDLEASKILPTDKKNENIHSVLTPEQQRKLKHHTDKFTKSHTFYKPHETETHYAFPLRLLVAIVVLLDFHSIFQIALGACTWGISYHVRPIALTTVILCCSITCNITGGVLISIGGKRTRKKDVLERMFRQQLTEDAMAKIERRRERELARNQELETPVSPEVR